MSKSQGKEKKLELGNIHRPKGSQIKYREGSNKEGHRNFCSRCGNPLEAVKWPAICEKCHLLYDEEVRATNAFYYIPGGMIGGVQHLLQGLKDTYPSLNLESEHLRQTPYRVARMLVELCWGLGKDPKIHLSTSFEETQYKGLIAVTNIQFTSFCAHHFAIFRGTAHVGYIPDGRIVGLSKINRIVEILAARPQVQENLTFEIADTLAKTLKPLGTAVVVQASHDCVEVRGVKSKGSITKTSDMRGVFLENKRGAKDEFLKLI